MCQMSVLLEQGGDLETVMESATRLEATPDGITVSALFEEPRIVKGAMVKSIDFLAGKVVLVMISEKTGE
ncbi:MAG: CooT family nickel-binding protein [Proteobacteria bacterium]|nr:CooT family nickel-binding protein [Pseudomonadota bacterium]MBU1709385.1 CooT family nickel-binding protein [Pseudomonadota bacterium]